MPTITCTSDNACPDDLRCVGIIEDFGENGPEVVTPGSCCPATQVCQTQDWQGPGSGVPFEICLRYGQRCDLEGRECDNPYYVACGGTCDCSPRSGRTRI